MRKNQKKNLKKAPAVRLKNSSIPDWMDCVWRRVSCGKATCPICGVQKTEPEDDASLDELWKSLESEENIKKDVLARISRKMRETGYAFEKIKTDRPRLPQPSEFSFYRKVRNWQRGVFDIISEAQDLGYLWPYSERAADLFWYANILLAKIYRQLVSRKAIEQDVPKHDPEYQYTQYVLGECVAEIKKSLHSLSCLHSEQKAELMLSLSRITRLEEDILKL